MLTLEQARDVLDTLARQTRMTRDDHEVAVQSIRVLYGAARDNQEDAVIPFTPPEA